jgi:hypothetical protein
MEPETLKKTIDAFLRLIDKGAESVQQAERLLRIYLDGIALASSEMEVPFDYPDYLGGSSKNEENLRNLISSRFPDYGFYNIPSCISKEIANTDIAVGDGIDDLLDITKELRSITHIWEREGSEKALPAFLAAYQFHLGDHLRDLQYYLHALRKDR